ncbi:MAG: transporter [Magnetococcales bacterium]|nr:transporter [Magnetococcales bacterium]
MKTLGKIVLAGLCAAHVTAWSPAEAGEQGHYVHGVEGIKAASLPPPGLYWRWYNVMYQSTSLRNPSGDKVPVGLDLDVFASVNRLIWMTPHKFLGADYGMDILVPLVNTDLDLNNVGVEFDKFGLGDIAIEPLLLAWHGANWDLSTALGLYLPTGSYSVTNPASPGRDFYTTLFTLGGTWYPDAQKAWSLSLLSRYEIHSEKEDTDVRLGDDFHFEWGVGHQVTDLVEVGVAGYAQWQLTDDRGANVTWNPNDHDRVFGIGPEVITAIPALKMSLSMRGALEFGAEDRPQGSILTVTMTKPL